MKLPQIIAALAGLLIAGCASVPREAGQQLAQTAQRYESIRRGMTRPEVVAALGAPQSQDANGRLRWEDRYDAKSFNAIEVAFDPAGKVISIEVMERREKSFLGRAYAATSISRSGFDAKRDNRLTADSSAVSGGIYHDYDYRSDGSISPYVPPKFP